MYLNRRRFIQMGSMAGVGMPFLGLSGFASGSRATDDWLTGSRLPDNGLPGAGELSGPELYNSFMRPPGKYRPFVRWWWNGDLLEEKEILRELDLMKAAGIGGVEINPIRFPGDTDNLGIKPLQWLGDEWVAMLKVALNGARERGIVCDMIVGTGWPFGGEFLERDDQIQMVALGTRDLAGGKTYRISRRSLLDDVHPDLHSKHEDQLKDLVSIILVPKVLNDLNSCVDLNDQLSAEEISVAVPPGQYVLYYLVKLTGHMAVINGAPGGGGPVLNHYSKPAVKRYLDRISGKLSASIGPLGEHFRAFFTDSLELEGANWCEDLFEQFIIRKGYDLAPYFPFILFKVGEMGNASKEDYGASFGPGMQARLNRTRYDFEMLRLELFKERFTATFVEWCRENGVASRMQAYGRPCDPVEASMQIDLPECETWLSPATGNEFSDEDYRIGRAYTMSNKYVSSGARLAGKKIISCEEMTNTGMVFNASLESIKIAGDQSILSGVTHSVLHGFNYSPPRAPFPGWIRYGTFFNERNTWWPWFRDWSDYKARLYSVLQETEQQADIALLPPLADLAMKFGFQRDPFPTFAYPEYIYQVWEAVHQHGGGCDYITERIVQQASSENGRLCYGTRSYKAVILISVDSLLPETARALRKFREAGVKLICIDSVPAVSPTNQGSGGDPPGAIADILQGAGADTAGVVAAPSGSLLDWYARLQKRFKLRPYVQISDPDPFVSQVYYRGGGLDIFFFSNYNSREGRRFKGRFDIQGKKAWLWDPHTGKRFLYPVESAPGQEETRIELDISLGPSESKLIIFDEETEGEIYTPSGIDQQAGRIIEGPWEIRLEHLDAQRETRSFRFDRLSAFTDSDALKTFGGTITYEHVFDMSEKEGIRYMNLGTVHGVAEVSVNDQPAGVQWYGSPVYDISALLKKGSNRIHIEVRTTLGNYMKSLENNAIAQNWTRHQPFYPAGIIGPVRLA